MASSPAPAPRGPPAAPRPPASPAMLLPILPCIFSKIAAIPVAAASASAVAPLKPAFFEFFDVTLIWTTLSAKVAHLLPSHAQPLELQQPQDRGTLPGQLRRQAPEPVAQAEDRSRLG